MLPYSHADLFAQNSQYLDILSLHTIQ